MVQEKGLLFVFMSLSKWEFEMRICWFIEDEQVKSVLLAQIKAVSSI